VKYRRLDENGDYVFGKQANNFYVDVPDAPAQAVGTRLKLLTGEWFLDLSEGCPYNPQVLGNRTLSTYDMAIQQTITETPGVLRLVDYSSEVGNDRDLTVVATIDTIYGQATLQEVL